ncbi:hypothetical protein J7K18_02780 [bacterium]|nr:hypothetical protein [bacterium]
MKRLVLLSVLFAFLFVGFASADPPDVCREAEEQLEVTQGLIDEVAPRVEESDVRMVHEIFERANDMQGRAAEMLEDGNCRTALRLTMQARNMVRRVVAFLDGDHHGRVTPEMAARAVRETDRLIERAEPVITESDNEDAQAMLERAVEIQEDAREALEDEQFERAFALTRRARKLVIRALRLVEDPAEPDPDRVLAALERTDEIIESSTEEITESGNEEAISLLERATEMQENAHSAYDEGNYRAAMGLTMRAREMVRRALRIIHSGPHEVTEEEAARVIEEVTGFIEEATTVIEESGDESAIALLDEANTHLENANSFFEEGNYRGAVAEALVARRLAARALRIVEGSGR